MFNLSIKQLFRQPGKALLFFLLMAASTALVVTGTILTIENNQRIDQVESTYTTIGMVEQLPVDTEVHSAEDSCVGTQTWTRVIYGDTIMMDVLDFPGADYIVKPEQRPYFVSYLPDLSYSWGRPLPRHIVEFTALESTDGTEPVEVEVTRVLHSQLNGSGSELGDGSKDKTMQVGDRFFFTQAGNLMKFPLKAGEKYVCNIRIFGMCQAHHQQEYSTYIRPRSDQYDTQGQKVETSVFDPVGEDLPQGLDASNARLDQVIGEDFYQPGHMGDIYLKLVEQHKMEDHLFAVMGVNSLNVLPAYHDGTITVAEGRAITQEEFDQGAMVCMLPQATASVNHLAVGDKVKLPLLTANYGLRRALYYDYSLLNAQGEFYQPFWEGEYEIVGLYTGEQGMDDLDGEDFWEDMFVIPEKSVGADWDDNIACWNPPSRYHATFQIPNGTIAQFDEALKANVPEVEELNITYDDRGYTEIMKFLRNARDMAHLLLLGGVLAVLLMAVSFRTDPIYLLSTREKE